VGGFVGGFVVGAGQVGTGGAVGGFVVGAGHGDFVVGVGTGGAVGGLVGALVGVQPEGVFG
jgi:hypothetical protein